MTERRATASRWYAIALATSALLSACSLLAPSDDELMGGHQSDAGSKGGAGTGGVGGNGGGTNGGSGGTSSGGTSTGGSSTGGSSTGGSSTGGSSTGGSSTGGSSTGGVAGAVTGGTGGSSTGGTGGSGTGGATGAGSVSCGVATCDLSSTYCCYRFTTGTKDCHSNGQQCLGGYVRCDGPEDCPGQICCATTGTYLGQQIYSDVRCRATCTASQVVFCGSDASVCPSGTTCQASSVAPEYNVCQ